MSNRERQERERAYARFKSRIYELGLSPYQWEQIVAAVAEALGI